MSDNKSTAVLKAFCEAEDIDPGDHIVWYLDEGEWVLEKETGEAE